jgi:hypothetical protein
MNEKRPIIITVIGDISILGAVLSILLVAFPNFLARYGFETLPVPFFSENIFRILLPIIYLIAAVGFLRLKSWGYWLMVSYSIFFLILFIIYCQLNKQLPTQNFMTTVIGLVFIVPTRKYFTKKVSIS